MTAANSVADVYHSIKTVLDIFKVNAPDTVDVPSKQVLMQAAEQIKTDAAKIGLLCSGGAPPQDQQVSLAAALQRSCVAFCTVCHAATAAAGPSLKTSLGKLAHDVITPCLALVKDMGSGQDLKSHVGLVWERVSGVTKAPFDNKACLFAAMSKVMLIMKDTLREMEELQQEQEEEYGEPSKPQSAAGADSSAEPSSSAAAENPAAAGGDAAAQTSSSDAQPANGSSSGADAQQQASSSGKTVSKAAADVDLDFEAEEMSYWERQLLTASIQLVQASAAVLKAFGKALLQGPGLAAGSEALDGWESCLWHSQHLRRAVEDLGAAMYPPQDLEELASASLAVFEVTELMADECPDAEAVGADTLSELNRQLLAAHEGLRELLTQAEQHEKEQDDDVQ